ncbi:MAG: 50S ribosomal protein L24 [Patescibacteria group bacterium]|jgi:large subunit ribosomal protein L24
MESNLKIKKGDTVIINSGKDRGKRGPIEKVFPKKNKVTVVGINVIKKHLKPSRKSPHGGIIDVLAPINASNVTIVCPRCTNPTRVGYQQAEGKKMRICRKCKESLDTQG